MHVTGIAAAKYTTSIFSPLRGKGAGGTTYARLLQQRGARKLVEETRDVGGCGGDVSHCPAVEARVLPEVVEPGEVELGRCDHSRRRPEPQRVGTNAVPAAAAAAAASNVAVRGFVRLAV